MSRSERTPCLSIVLEWDNVRLGETSRCVEVLRQLGAQTGELRGPVEILVAFDSLEVDRAVVADAVERTLLDGRDDLAVRLVAVEGARYYALKNAGVRHAAADVVVLVDGDAIPEPGWLAELLRPLASTDVDAVVGNTYVEPTGVAGKAFALAWGFPLRTPEARVDEHPSVDALNAALANNAAIRRSVLRQFPFPTIEGTSRTAGMRLAQTLRAHHVRVVHAPGARVRHPHLWDFAHGVAEGRDLSMRWALEIPETPGVLESIGRLVRALWRIARERRAVGLSAAGIAPAIAVAMTYYACVAFGRTLTWFHPRFMARRFQL